MTTTIITVIHILAAIGIIGLVLIQHGKGADAGAAFADGHVVMSLLITKVG